LCGLLGSVTIGWIMRCGRDSLHDPIVWEAVPQTQLCRSVITTSTSFKDKPLPNLIPSICGALIMPAGKERACTILGEFEQAETELVGKAVILTDGKAGTVESISLDEMHGLRIAIRGHEGKWPVSTIKFAKP
jgi:hypothetical protein